MANLTSLYAVRVKLHCASAQYHFERSEKHHFIFPKTNNYDIMLFNIFYQEAKFMAWYDEAIFYHIYPLGMTGAPKENDYGEPVHRLNILLPWISHIKEIGSNAIYIGPLFESVGHGYETTDYKKLDSRLGTNEDLTNFVTECHKAGIRVILDGVFNHTGRDFFAFKDIRENRQNSQYKDWYCNVNFSGNNYFNDGFSYENWGGYDLLAKLNQRNPAVRDYICDVIRFWVKEFDIDGLRLDAADVMDFDYMKALRNVANEVKPDFWLMGEVIHGNYSRWANDGTLHSVTNYMLHKALYSAHNDHNYFEVAHTIKYVGDMVGNNLSLYTFVDNHDVERIYTKLNNKAHFVPVHIMLYTLPGIPSIYYGSEFGIEGRKERGSDDSLRPALNFEDFKDAINTNPCTKLISTLGKIRQNTPALLYGDYKELELHTTHFAYERTHNNKSVIITVNNSDNEVNFNPSCGNQTEYIGLLTGNKANVNNGRILVKVPANYGEIWIPTEVIDKTFTPLKAIETEKTIESIKIEKPVNIEQLENIVVTEQTAKEKEQETKKADIKIDLNKPYEEMTIEELQETILEKMRKNGPVTDYMLGTVRENVYHDSLLNWVRSFN